MIFGYTVDFVDEPELNFHTCLSVSPHTIRVQALSLPVFETYTPCFEHSLRQIRYGYTTPLSEENGKETPWMMEVKDVLKLAWYPESHTIGYEKGEAYTSERLRFWIYHTFLPLLFQINGVYHILHAGCVEIGGKAVVFSAFSYGGKSTVTDYFLQKGHALLSDDTLAVKKENHTYRAIASWPYYRPYRMPEVLGKRCKNFVLKPLDIGAVYRLEKAEPDAEIEIVPIHGMEKFKAVHDSSFVELSFLKQRTFAFHTEFAKAMHIFNVTVPWDKERLNEVYQAITTHQKSI